MSLTWKDQLDARPELRQMNNWPNIIAADIPPGKRKAYIRNRRAVANVLSGMSIKNAAQKVNLSGPRVSQILARSLSSGPNGHPPLTKALVPGYRVRKGCRQMPLSQIDSKSGSRGAFKYLLETLPGLKSKLDEVILASLNSAEYSQNLTPESFHSEYLRLLVDLGWDTNKYPFDQVKQGAESCRKYFHERKSVLQMPKPKPNRVIVRSNPILKPYQEVQIDSQVLDVNTSILIEFNGQTVLTRISRLSVYMAIDVATGCILAYHLCLSKDPNQADLLSLLENIHTPWEPLELKTPGLDYEPGTCLPSKLGDRYTNAGIGMFRLDNALCHMAHLVRNYVCDTLESTLNFGLPAHPKGRNFIEYAFRRLNKHTHRFASTTGSHPRDPIKEAKKNAKKPPVLTLSAFEEVLSVVITDYNVKPQERLSGLSPLEIMKRRMADQLCRISFSRMDRKPSAFTKRQKVRIKRIEKENRRPHINFLRLRYSGDCLLDPKLVGKEITLEYDIRDVRQLTVLNKDMEVLGVVKAPRSWQTSPFSVHTKKRISKYVDSARLRTRDPLGEYFSQLLENKHLPKNATEIVRLQRETETGKIIRNESSIKDINLPTKLRRPARVFKWSRSRLKEASQ